jgi:hypothetical protein
MVNSKTVTVKTFIPIIDTGTGTAKGRGGGGDFSQLGEITEGTLSKNIV